MENQKVKTKVATKLGNHHRSCRVKTPNSVTRCWNKEQLIFTKSVQQYITVVFIQIVIIVLKNSTKVTKYLGHFFVDNFSPRRFKSSPKLVTLSRQTKLQFDDSSINMIVNQCPPKNLVTRYGYFLKLLVDKISSISCLNVFRLFGLF